MDLRQRVVVRALALLGADERRTLWFVALDSVVSERRLHLIEVLLRDDGVTNSSVEDGVSGLHLRNIVLSLASINGKLVHGKSPVSLIGHCFAPEDVGLLLAWLSIVGNVVPSKGNSTILTRISAKIETEKWTKSVLLTRKVDLFDLVDEGTKLRLAASGC